MLVLKQTTYVPAEDPRAYDRYVVTLPQVWNYSVDQTTSEQEDKQDVIRPTSSGRHLNINR